MPRTLLTAVVPKGPYPGTVTANLLDVAMVASDAGNGNYFVGTGRELVYVKNTDVGAQTITFTSKADPMSRTGDITTYSLGAGEMMAFWFGNLIGWDQGSGAIWIDTSDAAMEITIFRIP